MSASRRAPRPWHEVVRLRDDLKSGELSLAVFARRAADLEGELVKARSLQAGAPPAAGAPAGRRDHGRRDPEHAYIGYHQAELLTG